MGCYTHEHRGIFIRFADNDDCRCLCTFPHNDGETLEPSRLRSIVLFGAVCAMLDSTDDYFKDFEEGDSMFLPNDAPEWLIKEIERLFPDENKSA